MPGPTDRHFALSLEYCPNARLWGWIWVRDAPDPDGEPEVLASRGGFHFVLDAYQDAAKWAMMEAPMEITSVVCAMKH